MVANSTARPVKSRLIALKKELRAISKQYKLEKRYCSINGDYERVLDAIETINVVQQNWVSGK